MAWEHYRGYLVPEEIREFCAGKSAVLVVEDNLVKGAAGQAIQNMNLMFGLTEAAGLGALPVLP